MEALKVIYQKQGQGYQHEYEKGYLLLDPDLTGLLASKPKGLRNDIFQEPKIDVGDNWDEYLPVTMMKLSVNSYMMGKCNWKSV